MVGFGTAAFGLAFCCGAAELAPQTLFSQVSAHVAVLELADEKNSILSAHSTIAIGDGRFITSCEVLSGAPGIFVVDTAGRHPATLSQRDSRRNLCLLETADTSRAGVAIGDAQPRPGDRVYAVSNALGLGPGISEGVVSGMRSFGGETYIQFTAPIAPGSEGGGLFDGSGRLLGVIDYQRRDGQNINFAAPARWIAEISSRQQADDRRATLRDQANALSRQQKWQDLLAHAANWTAAWPDDADAWYWLAATAEYHGDVARAESGYREVRRLEPDSLKGGLGLVRALRSQSKFEDSRMVARGLLALRREDPDIWLAIGQAEAAMGNLVAAEEALRRAITLYPWATSAYEGLAWAAEQRGDVDAMVATWRQLLSLMPDSPVVSHRLADAYLRQNRPEQALAVLERVLQKAPEDGDAWFWKGMALSRLERPMAAIEAFQRSLAGKPRRPAWVWGMLGGSYYGLQMWQDAIDAYRQSVRLEPDEILWRQQLGVTLKDSAEFGEAMEIFRELTRSRPKDPFGWRQVGFVHGARNETKDAVAALEHALNLDPKQGKVWLALAEQYYKQGRREDVRRAYRQLQALDKGQAENAYLWFVVPMETTP